MLRSTLVAAMFAGAVSAGGLAAPAFADVESADPIKIAQGDWTTVQLNNEIISQILKSAGYNTELVPTEYTAGIAAIENNDLQLASEIWFTTLGDVFVKTVESGKGKDLGETGMQAKEELWFPEYMKEKCPGLPDWKVLNDCAKAFSSAETGEKGRYVAGPQSWGGYDEERVKALGLNWQVIHAGNDAALNAEIKSAYERKAPVMAWVYAPNWTMSVYKGEWINFPDYTPDCYNDPKWGTNPDLTHDCGKPHGPVKKLGSNDFATKWPKAFAMVGKYKMDNDTIGALAKEVDIDKRSVEDVAASWVKANEATWKKWLE